MKPYNNRDSKSAQVRSMFDNIAPHYDKLNHILSMGFDFGWRRKVVRMVNKDFAIPQVTPAYHASGYSQKECEKEIRILDLATGTGDLAIALARKIECSKTTGADPSEGMLEIAKQKIKDKGLNKQIDLELAFAEELPFMDDHFDAVTVAFGVRNFQGLGKSLKEMTRVLKNGGRIYILEFSTPEGKFFGKLYKFYFHTILPFFGGLISKDKEAYKYLPESVDGFPSPELFREMLAENGFVRCRSVSLTGGIAHIYTAQKIIQ